MPRITVAAINATEYRGRGKMPRNTVAAINVTLGSRRLALARLSIDFSRTPAYAGAQSRRTGMGSLQTRYMGITLANPIIAGSSDMTANIDGIKMMEDVGAGAVVLKSLFEEQIQLERFKLEEDLDTGSELYGEMASIFP